MAMLAAGAASAQTMLNDGQTARGQTLSRVIDRVGIIERYDCLLFVAPAGTRWTLEVAGSRYIRLSHECLPRGPAVYSASGNTLDFIAGGGAYFVVFGLTDIADRPSINGPWSVAVHSRSGGGGRTLAPGFTFIAGPPGVASKRGGGDARAPGEVFSDCPTCPQMAVLPGGSFMMGSPDEEDGREASEGPRHVVSIGSAFALGVTEVTFDEYDACSAEGACAAMGDGGWGRGRRPVIGVTWLDAQRYVGWLSRKTGQAYFLPSEAEWEYAARAGSDTAWNTGAAIIASDANILGQFGKTTPVGGFAANAFGLFDIHGNVAEWTQDCIDTGYVGAPNDGSVASGGDCSAQAVVRGGSHASLPAEVRSAARHGVSRDVVSGEIGFRVARAL